jgi:hypothetical protein
METKSEPKLRQAAHDRFGEDYEQALAIAESLIRGFARLAESMSLNAGHGIHQTVVFPHPLIQQWWVADREKRGDLVPRHPEEPPALMNHEDVIVLETTHSVKA